MIFIKNKLVKQKVILWIVSFCLILGTLCVPVSYAETQIYHQDELGSNVFGFSTIGNSQAIQVQAANFNDISRETIWTKDNFKGKYNLHFEDASGRNNSGAAVAESTNFNSQEWPAFYQILTGLPEGKPVEFSAWIKSENIAIDVGVGAYIAISYLNSAGQRISFNQSLNAEGSRDWKQFKATGIIPEGTVKVRISLIMYGKGKAYFDDAQLSVYPNAVQTKGAYSENVNLVITDEKLNSNLLGFAVQNNPFTFKTDGLTQEDKSLINSRISELKPAWVRVFVDTSWWAMSDGYNFNTSMMNALVEDLKMYNDIGSKINLVMWRPMELRSNEVIATQMTDLIIWLKNEGLNISGLTLYNEPDGEFPGTIEEYIAMYKTMAKALKSKELGNVELIGGDVALNDSFLNNIAKPLDSEIGMLSYHEYFKYKDSLKQPLFRAARNSMYSDKNLFLWESNETGGQKDTTATFTPGYDPLDGKLLAERYSSALKLTAYYLQSLAFGVKGISYWEVFDMNYSSSDKPKIMRFGMWGHKSEGFKLRPMYYAFQALSKNILPGATIHKVDVGENNSLVSYMIENVDGTRVLYALNPWDKPVQVSTTLGTLSDIKVSRYMFESDSVENAIQKQEVSIKATEREIAVNSKYTDIIPAESMLVLKLTKSMKKTTPERAISEVISEETPKITQEATPDAIQKATPESTAKATPEITAKATTNDIKEESTQNNINNDYRFISGKNKKITFKDISSSHWAKTSIEILAGEGIINGKDNNYFHPKDNITRSEFAKIAGELLGLKYNSAYKNPFKDIRSSDWYYEHVIKAVSGNIINGKSEAYFYPKDNITRQEVFTIIYRIASNYCFDGNNSKITKSANNNTEVYKDAGQISDYAKEALNTLLEHNIVSGYKDETLRPRNTMTRAEAAAIIYKVATTFKPKEKIEKVEKIENIQEPAINKETDKSVGRYKLTQSNSDNLIWTDYASERILKDSVAPSVTKSNIEVYMAKNEFQPFQLILKPTKTETVKFKLENNNAGLKVEIHKVEYVDIKKATDNLGQTGLYPDPLYPVEAGVNLNVEKGKNNPFWFTVHADENIAAGDYSINIAANNINIPVKIHVFNFEIPHELHVDSQMDASTENILDKYGVKGTGENYWKYVDSFKKLFIEHRLTPRSVLWSGGLTSGGGAPYIDYNSSTGVFSDPHGIWGFEYPADRYLAGNINTKNNYLSKAAFNGGFGFPSFMAATFRNNDASADQRPSTFGGVNRSDSDWYLANNPNSAYNKKWFKYMGDMEKYLEKKGYLNKAYYYFANEPQDEADYDAVAWYSQELKKVAPRLKLMVSEEPKAEIYNNQKYKGVKIDQWLAVLNKYNPEVSCNREKNFNEDTWIYFLHGTRPPYFNPITLDHPGVESKLTGWFLWKYRIKGIAYYSLNDWSKNVWLDTAVDGHNGDTFILYPPGKDNNPIKYGQTNHRFVSSIRFELMRDSLEDYEYLYMLNGKKNQKLGKKTCQIPRWIKSYMA